MAATNQKRVTEIMELLVSADGKARGEACVIDAIAFPCMTLLVAGRLVHNGSAHICAG
jgi:hypothetical protein